MRHTGKTPPFRGPDGAIMPGSIAEAGHRRIGGVAQWLLIRGANVANPPLVLLHGGPGFAETHFFRHFNAPLERRFTVVYWDQRGAGKSFDRTLPRATMTVEQLVSDLGEVVDYVCERLGQPRVVLYGHSWGSALGVLYAARHPERVAAYVGSGQLGDCRASERESYDYAVAEAERRGDATTLDKLRAIGPPPHSARQLWAERTALVHLEREARHASWWQIGRVVTGGPEYRLVDVPNLVRGFFFSLDAMWREVSTLNLIAAVPALRMPVLLFLGRHDHWVPPAASVAFLDALSAPSKRIVWFEESGHEPFVDEAEKFNRSMVELVLPLVAARLPGEVAPRPAAPTLH